MIKWMIDSLTLGERAIFAGFYFYNLLNIDVLHDIHRKLAMVEPGKTGADLSPRPWRVSRSITGV